MVNFLIKIKGTCKTFPTLLQNSEESLRTVLEFVKEAEESGISINRRCLIFVAALAQRQNHPHITLEYLAKARNVSHIALRNLRVSVSIDGTMLR